MSLMRTVNDRGAWPLYLFGPVGRGKSFSAALVYVRWTGSAMFLTYSDLIALSIRADKEGTVSRTLPGGQIVEYAAGGWWKWLADVQLLVVDEIGTGMAHEWRCEMLWKCLELRKQKPLILTGNLSLEGIGQQFDARIKSRILAGTAIELAGVDQRAIGLKDRIGRIET